MNFAHRRLNRNTGKVIFIDLIVKNKFPAYFHFDFCAAQEDFAIFFFFFSQAMPFACEVSEEERKGCHRVNKV